MNEQPDWSNITTAVFVVNPNNVMKGQNGVEHKIRPLLLYWMNFARTILGSDPSCVTESQQIVLERLA